MPMSRADQAKVEQGVATFLDELAKEEARARGENVKVEVDPTGNKLLRGVRPDMAEVGSIIEARFGTQAEALAFTTKAERLQSKGEGLWQCVVRALHRRLCGNAEASKKIRSDQEFDWPFAIFTLKDRILSPAVDRFIAHLRDFARSM